MEPVRSSKKSIEEMLAPTRRNPVTGQAELVPAKERIDSIISHPQAASVVAALDPQLLFGLVSGVGKNDALSLIELATPEQLQLFVDFDAWSKEDFQLVKFTDWMEILLQSEDERFAEIYKELDHETFVLWFREAVAVYEWEADVELLDRIEGQVYTSPCGQYALVIPEEENYGPEIRHFLERLYQLDVEEALTLMSEARWALSVDMHESLYRKRTARLSEFGFVPIDEAVAVYGYLEPIAWAKKQRERLKEDAPPRSALPVGELQPMEQQVLAVQEALGEDELPWFPRAITQLSQTLGDDLATETLGSVMAQYRALAQRVLVADQGTPGEPDATAQASRRTLDTLSLGLEFLTDSQPDLAAKALATIPLRDIHRAGHSITLQMQRQVREILRRGNLSVTDQRFSLLQPEDAAVCEGLLQARPRMSATSQKRFRTMADVQYVANRLGQVAFAELLFFAWMGFDRESLLTVLYDEKLNTTPVELITYRTLFATLVLNRIFDNERALMPMSTEELDLALKTIKEQPNPFSYVLERSRILVEALQPADQRMGSFSLAFVAETATWLVDEMLSHEGPTSRKIAKNWVLLRPKGAAAPTHDAPIGKATVH